MSSEKITWQKLLWPPVKTPDQADETARIAAWACIAFAGLHIVFYLAYLLGLDPIIGLYTSSYHDKIVQNQQMISQMGGQAGGLRIISAFDFLGMELLIYAFTYVVFGRFLFGHSRIVAVLLAFDVLIPLVYIPITESKVPVRTVMVLFAIHAVRGTVAWHDLKEKQKEAERDARRKAVLHHDSGDKHKNSGHKNSGYKNF